MKKRKEIEQRSKNELLFKCSCGHPHYVEFDYDLDPGWKYYSVSIVDPCNMGPWDRIKKAIKYIRGKRYQYWMSVDLNSKDLIKIKKHIDKYLNEKENRKRKPKNISKNKKKV